jgi:hypothetical protein
MSAPDGFLAGASNCQHGGTRPFRAINSFPASDVSRDTPSTEIGPDKSEEVADFATFLYRNLGATAIRRQPGNHPGHLDHDGTD